MRNKMQKASGIAAAETSWRWFQQADSIFNRGQHQLIGACETGHKDAQYTDKHGKAIEAGSKRPREDY